jgi:hypothetical protein
MMNKYHIIPIFLLLLQTGAFSQSGLDSLLKRIDNKDAQIGFVTRAFSAAEIIKTNNPAPLVKPHGQVMSLDVDSLAALYSRHLLVSKLVPLLEDTSKDFYANAILYALFERAMPPLNTRANWLKTTAKKDIEYWQKYIRKKK